MGLLVIWTVKDRTVLFVLMLILMTGAYSFMRTRYLVSVVLMTPYILIMFHLLDSGEFTQILRDRLIDTASVPSLLFWRPSCWYRPGKRSK